MATRSTISLEFADGTIQSVYCHWDGYLDNNGAILQKHYMDPFKVSELINLGSMSSLAPEIGTKHSFENPHPYKSAEWQVWYDAHRNQCTFYGRDRGENDVGPDKFVNFSDYRQNLDKQEYDYILRQIDGKPVWFVRSYMTGNIWISLEKAFQAEKECAE